MRETESKQRILDATLRIFNEKGLKFTMDDIAKEVGMSKKTIYTVFDDKEDLFYQMADYTFDSIKEAEAAVLGDPELSTVDKIRRVLGVMPDRYRDIDLRKLYVLRDKFPTIYARVRERLESDWEPTIRLLQQGIDEGVLRPFSIPIFKVMLEAAIEQFFQRDVLIENHLTYYQGLDEVVGILVDGIVAKNH